MPRISPWQGLTAAQLDVPGHDPDTCPSCTPVGTPPYQAGVERALETQAILPLAAGVSDA